MRCILNLGDDPKLTRREYPGLSPTDQRILRLLVLDQHIHVRCDPHLERVLTDNFGAMVASDLEQRPADVVYSITGISEQWFEIHRSGIEPMHAQGLDGLVHALEKDLTIELQKRRPDLLFLHAAAVEWRGRVAVLAADSGTGKSTTAWGLLNRGFGYLSDELCPIDLETMRVLAYPHALCMKGMPPVSEALPEETLHLGRTMHVPARLLPGSVIRSPCDLGTVFLLNREPNASRASVQPISAAEAAARIYVATLNALAHRDRGMRAALSVATHSTCYRLNLGTLPETCELVRSTLESVARAHQ